MATRTAYRLLELFWLNVVETQVDTLDAARRLIHSPGSGLTVAERHFLEVALHDKERLAHLYELFCCREWHVV